MLLRRKGKGEEHSEESKYEERSEGITRKLKEERSVRNAGDLSFSECLWLRAVSGDKAEAHKSVIQQSDQS